MTIIAAATGEDGTWIGCDQAGTDGWGFQTDFGSKLLKFPFGVVGFTGSYRPLQAIRDELWKVRSLSNDAEALGLVAVVDEALGKAGWGRTKNDGLPRCDDLCLLIATPSGAIYKLESNLAILRPDRRFAAVGSGYQVAVGAMYALDERVTPVSSGGEPAENLVGSALRAACAMISTCGGEPVLVKVTQDTLP